MKRLTKAEIEYQIKNPKLINLYEAHSISDLHAMILSMEHDLFQMYCAKEGTLPNPSMVPKLELKVKYLRQAVRIRTAHVLGDLAYEN